MTISEVTAMVKDAIGKRYMSRCCSWSPWQSESSTSNGIYVENGSGHTLKLKELKSCFMSATSNMS